MADITEILDMLEWHMPSEIQTEGISLARNTEPWKVTADVYGGVQTRIHEQMYIEDGFRYLETVGRIPMVAKSYVRIWRFPFEK